MVSGLLGVGLGVGGEREIVRRSDKGEILGR